MSPIDAINLKNLKGLTQDSRQVKDGYLFAALRGVNFDGADYIDDAIQAGASVILGAQDTPNYEGVEIIRSDQPRRDFSKIVANFYQSQPHFIAAVTGTNGKTSVVSFMEQLWHILGIKGACLGTLTGGMTTPDPVELHQALAQMKREGITHLAMEASSHGLDQYRLEGVRTKVAGFTNLSRDHLDYHKNMSAYLRAKLRLFTEYLDQNGTAVINADSPEFTKIKSNLRCKIISYGYKGCDFTVKKVTPVAHGLDVVLKIFGISHTISLPLVGEFQLMNVLCALAMVVADDPSNQERTQKLIDCLETISGVPGRVQSIKGHPEHAGVYVDYAHTPDALETVLKALRPHTKGRLVCLFGCGGDRDPGKRPIMSKIVSQYADHGIITDDNPRSEDPARIRQQALEGAPMLDNIEGRREAIQHGIDMVRAGDILLIAGKGHEQGQIFKEKTEPFDDAEEARKAIESYKQNKSITNRGVFT